MKDALCAEIDNAEDLALVTGRLRDEEKAEGAERRMERNKTVYLCFSTDIIHGGISPSSGKPSSWAG